MIRYEAVDNSVKEMVEKVINGFPEKFIHININDLHLTFKDAKSSTWNARTRLLNDFYQSLTNKKIGIEIWKQYWITAEESMRALTIYHELMHITYDKNKKKYKLQAHDVQNFYEILSIVGLNNENIDQLVSKLK